MYTVNDFIKQNKVSLGEELYFIIKLKYNSILIFRVKHYYLK